jgi:Cu/Ag efflux pump CusA
MEGRPGAFFEPLALAYVAALLASTIVAVTVTPALILLLGRRDAGAARESALMQRIGALYAGALARVVGRPRAAMLAAGGCVLAGLALLPFLGTSVIPSFKDRNLLVHLDAQPGTSQPAMTRIARDASAKLQAIEGVRDVGAHIGRAVTGDQIVDVNSSELWVDVDRDADYDRTVADVKRTVAGLRGLHHDVVTYTQQKIRDVGTLANGEQAGPDGGLSELTGTRRPLDVRVFGEDLAVLRPTAEQVRRLVAGIDGVVAPRVDLQEAKLEPTLEIEVDLDAARRHGIKPGDVRRAEAILLQGIGVGSIFGKQKVFDVVVQGIPSLRTSVANVRNLLIDGQDGNSVRLGDVAHVTVKQAPSVIRRDAVSRRLDVVAGIQGRSAGDVADDVRARLKQATFFPLEYHAEVLTDSTAKEIGTSAIAGSALAVLIAMFLLLQVALRSWRTAALVFLTLPVALAGGVLASLLNGAELSLGSLAALVAVFALAVRGSLLLVTRLQQLGADEPPTSALVQQGAREQLLPILAVTVATAAMLLPFAVRGDIPGLEIVHPLAIVMLGGLVASTLVTLFVVPALYLRFAAQPAPAEDDLLHRWAGLREDRAAADDAPWIVALPELAPQRAGRRRFARSAPVTTGDEGDDADGDGDGDGAPTAPAAPPAQAS